MSHSSYCASSLANLQKGFKFWRAANKISKFRHRTIGNLIALQTGKSKVDQIQMKAKINIIQQAGKLEKPILADRQAGTIDLREEIF